MIKNYIKHLKEVLNSLDLDKVDLIKDLIHNCTGTIYLIGNGGSASTAEHFAIDLLNSNKKAISLVSNMADITAIANDLGYDKVFSFQLDSLKPNLDDLLIAISVSGESKNIIEAAKDATCPVIAMTGLVGGRLKDLADVTLFVPSSLVQIVEDVHLIIEHSISRELTWI